MKRLIVCLILAVMLLSVLASCGARGVTFRTDTEVVTAQTKEITLLLENKSGFEIGHGYPDGLEFKVDGEWKRVEGINADWHRDIGLLTKNGRTAAFTIDNDEGSLEAGEYRVQIEYRFGTGIFRSSKPHTATVEFSVTE